MFTIGIYLKAVIIAIVEGLSEFIPISSTGHMILVGDLIQFTGEKAATFEIFIQLGAILAVVVIYWEKFTGLIPVKRAEDSWTQAVFFNRSYPTNLQILVAIVPFLIVGFFAHKYIKLYLFNPVTVAIGLIVGGILMIVVEKLPLTFKAKKLDQISLKQAFLVGLGQCAAVWPGMSRSGSTMITGLLVGVKHKPVADFSFIIAVPVMCAAVGYDLLKSYHLLEPTDIPYFALGFLVSFLVGWASVKWFLKVLTTIKLIPFGIYRIILGVFSLWFFS
ncbi:MAG: undecaprenyl-diphosphate phosphatase [Deltaproteobacteria bacterium]|jgi:undecaprenyl-diphosphatase|nr:undecaprenyl-diphosphate phosphatase [Deltaproteobacteria bacterium]MBT4524985.1 undecaprenyl-diphosphate phosphatase [Deltaproteobacteria bacterium]